jgi:hypothetical protein
MQHLRDTLVLEMGVILSGNMAVIVEKLNTYMDLVTKPERKKQLGKAKRRSEDMLNYISMKCDGRL